MSTFWSLWIIGLTTTNLVLILWVLLANRKVAVTDDDDPENKTMGHSYDGIEEYDNPLPKWWFMMFLLSMVFAVAYLIVYPGMGSYKGYFPLYEEGKWTSVRQLEKAQQKAQKSYQSSYGVYSKKSIVDLANEPRAMKMASRLFANNCAVCHGADGGGSLGFPNLTDNDWLYGGDPETIKYTIVHGRQAAMPAWSSILGEAGINDVAQYVLKVSDQEYEAEAAEKGQEIFVANCASCHGNDAKGLYEQGAPNLTDNIWLYEGTPAGIRQTLRDGRNGNMPAQKTRLRDDKIHLLAAYVYSLSLEER